MPHAYNEDQLVEQPSIALLAELGWQVAGEDKVKTALASGQSRVYPDFLCSFPVNAYF